MLSHYGDLGIEKEVNGAYQASPILKNLMSIIMPEFTTGLDFSKHL